MSIIDEQQITERCAAPHLAAYLMRLALPKPHHAAGGYHSGEWVIAQDYGDLGIKQRCEFDTYRLSYTKFPTNQAQRATVVAPAV